MRSLLVFVLFAVVLPFAIARPYLGVYLWSVLGYLNPHRLTWGAAYDFPFALVTAVGTLVGLVITRDRSAPPASPLLFIWIFFIAWMCVTTLYALHPEQAFVEWDRMIKIQMFTLLTIILINSSGKLRALIWTIALSIGFYGIKGGVFAIATGASYRVWGPVGSFIAGNNSIGLAFVMTLPLQWYLMKTTSSRKAKYAMRASLVLTIIATLATHSRGAFLGLSAITIAWLLNERRKWLAIVLLVISVPATVMLMPNNWVDRMETLKTYEQDRSAMERISAWRFAMEISSKRLTGGGFGAFVEESYREYAPEVSADIDNQGWLFQNSHSIYFSALGDHGIPGLVLFLALLAMTMRKSRQLQKLALQRGHEDFAVLAAAIRIGLIGYAVSGAFLNLAYFDLYYHFFAIIVILERQLSSKALEQDPTDIGPVASVRQLS